MSSYLAELEQLRTTLAPSNVLVQRGLRDITLDEGFETLAALISSVKKARGSVYLVGNGGSAAVISHISNDLINLLGIRAVTLHEPSVITCQANDYGYENCFANQLEKFSGEDDLLIVVSSSGRSANIINACDTCRVANCQIVSYTAFDANNDVRMRSDLSFYLATSSYSTAEIGHLFLLHSFCNKFAES